MSRSTHDPSRFLALAAVALTLPLAACGSATTEAETPPSSESGAGPSPVPASLSAAESAAEDGIDLALAGDRTAAIAASRVLESSAAEAAVDLRSAGVPQADLAELERRAAAARRIAGRASPIRFALASNRAFASIVDLFGRFDGPVPGGVMRLDYLEFESKLQALAGDRAAAASAVRSLDAEWSRLRPDVMGAGGETAARRFSTHVDAMQRLLAGGGEAQLAREAQHGLDLVDELEAVYPG